MPAAVPSTIHQHLRRCYGNRQVFFRVAGEFLITSVFFFMKNFWRASDDVNRCQDIVTVYVCVWVLSWYWVSAVILTAVLGIFMLLFAHLRLRLYSLTSVGFNNVNIMFTDKSSSLNCYWVSSIKSLLRACSGARWKSTLLHARTHADMQHAHCYLVLPADSSTSA